MAVPKGNGTFWDRRTLNWSSLCAIIDHGPHESQRNSLRQQSDTPTSRALSG